VKFLTILYGAPSFSCLLLFWTATVGCLLCVEFLLITQCDMIVWEQRKFPNFKVCLFRRDVTLLFPKLKYMPYRIPIQLHSNHMSNSCSWLNCRLLCIHSSTKFFLLKRALRVYLLCLTCKIYGSFMWCWVKHTKSHGYAVLTEYII